MYREHGTLINPVKGKKDGQMQFSNAYAAQYWMFPENIVRFHRMREPVIVSSHILKDGLATL